MGVRQKTLDLLAFLRGIRLPFAAWIVHNHIPKELPPKMKRNGNSEEAWSFTMIFSMTGLYCSPNKVQSYH